MEWRWGLTKGSQSSKESAHVPQVWVLSSWFALAWVISSWWASWRSSGWSSCVLIVGSPGYGSLRWVLCVCSQYFLSCHGSESMAFFFGCSPSKHGLSCCCHLRRDRGHFKVFRYVGRLYGEGQFFVGARRRSCRFGRFFYFWGRGPCFSENVFFFFWPRVCLVVDSSPLFDFVDDVPLFDVDPSSTLVYSLAGAFFPELEFVDITLVVTDPH